MRHLFALANDFKEGDLLVGGTCDDRQRLDARTLLLSTTVGEIRRAVFVDDGVTGALDRGRDRRFDGELDPLPIARLKSHVLSKDGPAWISRHGRALTSEVIAAIAKVMTSDELSGVARSLCNPLEPAGPLQAGAPEGPQVQDVVIGSASHFGSRIQPNSPGDDEDEILFSILDGLAHGCGDVIIGLNPASDDVETIVRLEQLLEQIVVRLGLPTRYCVLSDIVKQHAARSRARVDVGFQSLAGTSPTLVGMVGLDVDGIRDLAGAFDGLYFETGQGSAVTNGTACDVDMVTLEARAYGVARLIRDQIGDERGRPPWMIVNDVAGFIGPEVFRTGEQLQRACLEDVVMARLHGLTMGLDVCATFHMGIAPADLRLLTATIVERAAPAYLMAVAGNADPMLGYLTTSFREHPGLRRATGRRITSSMERRLSSLGVAKAAGAAGPADQSATVAGLYAAYCKAGGDRRSSPSLENEAGRRLDELRGRGFDLAGTSSEVAASRVDALYVNARAALFATLSAEVLSAVAPRRIVVRTASRDRDDYLTHPATGERLADEGMRSVASLYPDSRPVVQLVISDGLNALAVNEQLRRVLPPLRYRLSEAGVALGHTDVVVENGRVRAGYEIGGLVGAEVVVHLLGERPGTGLNTLSAYVTYGRDSDGRSRWSSRLDHSATNAVCGIHPKGKAPERAADEIARLVRRTMEQRRSGVGLLGT
jgi:ethanolamine ammonia-lyase large subunit